MDNPGNSKVAVYQCTIFFLFIHFGCSIFQNEFGNSEFAAREYAAIVEGQRRRGDSANQMNNTLNRVASTTRK
jgi:hypothetical protein